MNRLLICTFSFVMLFVCCRTDSMADVEWNIDNLQSIGGNKTTVAGSPKVIETKSGKAVEFDGLKDGLIVEALPLAGAEKFTLEVIFRPDANGLDAQRVLHLQENDTKHRIMIILETLPPFHKQWYLDTFIKSAKGGQSLYKPENIFPAGQWYSAALVYDGQQMRNYINGVMQTSGKLEFSPLGKGSTSIGVKMNQTSWFKGAVRKIRFADRVLEPKEFLKP